MYTQQHIYRYIIPFGELHVYNGFIKYRLTVYSTCVLLLSQSNVGTINLRLHATPYSLYSIWMTSPATCMTMAMKEIEYTYYVKHFFAYILSYKIYIVRDVSIGLYKFCSLICKRREPAVSFGSFA
jgi:E3 ubiquitin-protein ligase DOA10